jgi:degradative hydroxymethylglutaryl-CoA reductase
MQLNVDNLRNGGLTLERADLMVENCIGMLGVPVGLALNFLINGKFHNVPMAIEEPSVIAAASAAAKLVADNGGFTATSTRPVMIG